MSINVESDPGEGDEAFRGSSVAHNQVISMTGINVQSSSVMDLMNQRDCSVIDSYLESNPCSSQWSLSINSSTSDMISSNEPVPFSSTFNALLGSNTSLSTSSSLQSRFNSYLIDNKRSLDPLKTNVDSEVALIEPPQIATSSNIESNLRGNLFLATSSASIDSNKLRSTPQTLLTSLNSSSMNDLTLVSTDPKNIIPLIDNNRSVTSNQDIKSTVNPNEVAAHQKTSLINLQPIDQQSQLNDIVPTLTKVPFGNIEDVGNLPINIESNLDQQVDIQSLSSPITSSNLNSSWNNTSKIKPQISHSLSQPSAIVQDIRYNQTPEVRLCPEGYTVPALRLTTDQPNSTNVVVAISEGMRLTPDIPISARATPTLRLIPGATKSIANLDPILSTVPSLEQQQVSIGISPSPGKQVRIVPTKQPGILFSSDSVSTNLLPAPPAFVTQNAPAKYVYTTDVRSHKSLPRLSLFAQPDTTLVQKRTIDDLSNQDTISVTNTHVIDDTDDVIDITGAVDSPAMIKNKNIEQVSCYKCTYCGFLSTSVVGVETHMSIEHDEEISDEENESWLDTAQREGISLSCPMCPNRFQASRSFKVHLMDDHSISENKAEEMFKEENKQRKLATTTLIKKQREEERKRRKQSKEDILEAYLDSKGELRVRSIYWNKESNQQTDLVNNSSMRILDVSAGEYVEATLKSKKEKKEKKIDSNEQNSTSSSSFASVDNKPKRVSVGRPMGSRTVGITKLRRINPNIQLSTEKLGEECGIQGCAVRLKDANNLEYHQSCHNQDGSFVCQECNVDFSKWPNLALHLWRIHRIDMELYSCNECDSFRSFTLSRLDAHKVVHSSERPFLCEEKNCDKSFKTNKSYKIHKQTHQSIESNRSKNPGKCSICSRTFGERRLLKLHMDSVHRKIRPHLCNYCGYSASSKSSLKLHLRLHTGEKPYSCDVCDYKTADHNSLRRHRLRHSGEKPYKCPHCPYSCIQSSTYKVHLRNKHPGSTDKLVFNCDLCLFKTIKEGNYLSHIAEHHNSQKTIIVSPLANKCEVKTEEPDTTTDKAAKNLA